MEKPNIVIIGHASFNQLLSKWWKEEQVTVLNIDKKYTSMESILQGASYVFDTVTAPTELKKRLVREIDQLTEGHVPIFSSTLHHTASEISSWCEHTERIIGFHPLHFNEMKVIEIAPALQTAEEILQQAASFLKQYGKKIEVIKDEVAGVFPRTLALIVNEACYALGEEIASAEDIDIAMKKGTNYPLGPLEWADRVGVHHIFWILEGLHRDFGDDRYRPAPMLRKKMLANQLGLATGKGFYCYD